MPFLILVLVCFAIIYHPFFKIMKLWLL